MKPFGDCIIAGKFLEQFIEGHENWAHLDIAGVAFGNVGYAKDKARLRRSAYWTLWRIIIALFRL
jgi:leucyl aminopeptidase